jgi:hypothetical protein
MTVTLTQRERSTILAALRRWLSYPAARAADPIATDGGNCKPLDNTEIEQLCGRIDKTKSKSKSAQRSESQNGATRD